MVEGIHTLKNGRKYKIEKSESSYTTNEEGNYAQGGFHITAWEQSYNDGKGMWVYIDNSPSEESVKAFLKAAERLAPRES